MTPLQKLRAWYWSRRIAKLEAALVAAESRMLQKLDERHWPEYGRASIMVVDLRSQLQIARARSKA